MSLESKWRLIPFLKASGAVQMALDWWLLQQHRLGKHPPCLRFYTWQPPAISLGYHQSHYPEFWQNLTWRGNPLNLVRRPTGGRGVLHQGDLTYMVVTSGIEGKTMKVYQTICQFLIEGFKILGIELNYGTAGKGYINHPNCFTTPTAADLIDSQAGEKLIGSAQLRQGKAILQHGSIILAPDTQLYTEVFAQLPPKGLQLSAWFNEKIFKNDEQMKRWGDEKIFSQEIIIELLIKVLTDAAANYFAVKLIREPLSETEWQEVLAISKTKFPIINL